MSSFLSHSKKITAILAALAALVVFLTVGSKAFFADRANETVSFTAASFSKDGYTLERSAPEGYFTAGESVQATIQESNEKDEPVDTIIYMSAVWKSPDANSKIWGNRSDSENAILSVDGSPVDYSVETDGSISFQLPVHTLDANAKKTSRVLAFEIPSSLKGTGSLSFSFAGATVSQSPSGWSNDYSKEDLNKSEELSYIADVAWNISSDQSTKDVIAQLSAGASADEYGLEIFKNGQDGNTNQGKMMDWTSGSETPWAAYNITDLIIGKISSLGANAFQGEENITGVVLPYTVDRIGANAFDGAGLSGTLKLPSSVSKIEELAFANLPKMDTITFEHSDSDSLILPAAGEGTGAFYLSDLVETDITGTHPMVQNYDWVADNRAKTVSPLESAALSYDDVAVGSTVDPQLTIKPENAVIVSRNYEITAGEEYASIDPATGTLTGKAAGSVIVKVTLTDEFDVTVEAVCVVKVVSTSEGARYVWDRFKIESSLTNAEISPTGIRYVFNMTKPYLASTGSSFGYDFICGDSLNANNEIIPTARYPIYYASVLTDIGNLWVMTGKKYTSDIVDRDGLIGYEYTFPYPHGTFNGANSQITKPAHKYWTITRAGESKGLDGIIVENQGTYAGMWPDSHGKINESDTWIRVYEGTKGVYRGSTSKGEFVGNSSSDSGTAYPKDAISGSFWYTYKGADNIDPTSISYSADSVKGGESVTVTVDPSTKNVYGGEISYLYEYSTDDGKTWTAAATTTETSLEISVPAQEGRLIVRVRANDNWGYTSDQYIYGRAIHVLKPVAITSAALSYPNINVGATVDPTLTVGPSDAKIMSQTYKITSGTGFASIDSSTGSLTGKANGIAVVQVTIVDITGTEIIATCPVQVGSQAVGTRYVSKKYNADMKMTTSLMPGGLVNTLVGVQPSSAVRSIAVGSSQEQYVDSQIIRLFSDSAYTNYAPAGTNVKLVVGTSLVQNGGQLTIGDSTAISLTIPSGNGSYTESGYISLPPKADKLYVSFGTSTSHSSVVQLNLLPNDPKYCSSFKVEIKIRNGKPTIAFRGTKYESAISNTHVFPMTTPSKVELSEPYSKGTYLGYASSSTQRNGVVSGYWYEHVGSDSIDPTAVRSSADSVNPGDSFTVSVTPGTPIYSGTISYLYQYSTDGGVTWTAAATTTAAEQEITVPEGASSFMVRVRAQDDIGYMSPVYVYGQSISVVPST